MARSVIAEMREASPDEITPERQAHDEALREYVRMFEEAEESTAKAREKAERDRDYYDGKQWTEEEAAELRKRGQPIIALNVIRSRINYHLGMEKKQRRDPKAFGRGPQDQESAEVATQALRYAMARTNYHTERSGVWENIKIEGLGALEASLKQRADGGVDIIWKRVPWDRFFFDPHSARPDFSDALYVGQVVWMDKAELEAAYPDAEAAIDLSLTSPTNIGNTYDDRPRWQLWADPKRKRLRVVQLWHKRGGTWHFCEFVFGGILSAGESPFVDDQGESLCGIIAESCFVDRENNRYGEVRDLVDPQDEVNKRRSKALHAVNTNLIITEQGAIPDGDREKARREANRPDGFIEVTKGFRFEVDRNTEMASGQAQLLMQAQAHIASTGPNMALLGKGTEDQSGRAIQAQQQGGLIELGDGLDVLRRLDHRVFKHTWHAIKQYWQAPQWIRITEDEQAPQYVGINQPQIDPMTGEMTIQNAVAEMDVDIEIEDAPDVASLEGETYAATIDVLSSSGGNPMMMKFIAELHPGLTPSKKRKLIQMADEFAKAQAQAAEQQQKMLIAEKQADILAKKSKAETDQGRLELDAMAAGASLAEKASRPAPSQGSRAPA